MSYFGNNAQICAHVPVPMNIAHYLPCCLPLCSGLSAVHFPALRRQLPGRPPNTYRQSNTPILSDNIPRLSVNSPIVFCITPKVLKNALAAHREVSRSNLSPAGLPDSFVVGGDYKIAATWLRPFIRRWDSGGRGPHSTKPTANIWKKLHIY